MTSTGNAIDLTTWARQSAASSPMYLRIAVEKIPVSAPPERPWARGKKDANFKRRRP